MTDTSPIPILTAPQLAEAFARNTRILGRQVAGLTHADSLLQPAVRGNCLNWVVGHIAVHRDDVLEALGEVRMHGGATRARYHHGSDPITGDGEGVLPLDTLLASIDQAQVRIAAALTRATASDLAKEAPTDEPALVGEEVFFLYWHDSYHVGQTEYLRQLAGTDDQII